MAIVPSSVIATAREILQDTVADYRYTDASLYVGLNMALREAKRLRPDIWLSEGKLQPVPTITTTNAGEPLPIDEQFENAITFFVVGWAELRDDQYSQEGRAPALMGQFKQSLIGG